MKKIIYILPLLLILVSCWDAYTCKTDECYLEKKRIESKTRIEEAKYEAQKYINKPENNTDLEESEIDRVAMETCVNNWWIPDRSSWDWDIKCTYKD